MQRPGVSGAGHVRHRGEDGEGDADGGADAAAVAEAPRGYPARCLARQGAGPALRHGLLRGQLLCLLFTNLLITRSGVKNSSTF